MIHHYLTNQNYGQSYFVTTSMEKNSKKKNKKITHTQTDKKCEKRRS